MMRAWLMGAVLLLASPSAAETPSVTTACEQAPSFDAERDRLRELTATLASDREAAADAWLALGELYEYESASDSAIACYRRAIERRGGMHELLAATDALFRRSGSGDAAEALGYADQAINVADETAAPGPLRGRQAWARFLTGRTAEARTMFSRIERSLYRDPLWLLRMGQVLLEHGELERAFAMLFSVALASRGQSDDAMDLIARVAGRMNVANRSGEQIQYELSVRDRRHEGYLKKLGGRRIQFAGAERFPLGATAFVPESRGTLPAIVALIAPTDSLPSWDSLAVRLRQAGFAALYVDGRGSGWSVARSAPLPAAWAGRRARMTELSAADAREALRALALSARVDTTGYTVMASGSMAMAALLAAERDRRVHSVVLASPDLERVERGPAPPRVARLQVPLYITETRLDRLNQRWVEPLYQAAPAGVSRIADATGEGGGTGPAALGTDAPGVERLTRWLREKKPARAAAGPPRGSRR